MRVDRHTRPDHRAPARGLACSLAVVAVAWLAVPAGPAAAQSAGTYAGQNPCADLGSFVVVDGPPVPRGQPLVAQPYQPCADLPARPQPRIFIDAQVQVGQSQAQSQQDQSQQDRFRQDQLGEDQLRVPQSLHGSRQLQRRR